MTTSLPLATTDNAQGQLVGGISASQTSIALKAGEGSLFPQTINGQATSVGTKNRLNQTGIGATGIAVYDGIYNIDDESAATVTEVNADYILTTDLTGGTANIFDNAEEWVVNPFITTIEQRTGGVVSGAIEKMEQILVLKRTTDTFAVVVRGYAGTTPAAMNADSFVSLYWTKSGVGELTESVNLLRALKANILDAVMQAIGTTEGDLMYFDGSEWIRLGIGTNGDVLNSNGTIPFWGAASGADLGEVKQFALSLSGAVTATALRAAGWALCDGSTPVSQGITSPTIATTPNLAAKFVRGAATAASGNTGGADTVSLSVAQMPSHGHSQRFPTNASSAVADMTSDIGTGGSSAARGYINTAGSGGAFKLKTYNEGSGSAHENKPPYYELALFIKVK